MNTDSAIIALLVILNAGYSVWATIILATRIERIEKSDMERRRRENRWMGDHK